MEKREKNKEYIDIRNDLKLHIIHDNPVIILVLPLFPRAMEFLSTLASILQLE